MKFNQALLALLATTASVAVAIPTHRRLDYDSLASSSSPDLLLEALSQNGLVSITNLPNNFHETKRSVLSHLHSCLMDMEGIDDSAATVAMTTRLRDGTIRRSIATTPSSTLPSSLPDTAACRRFQADSAEFRASVENATETFADRLSTELSTIMKPSVGSGSPVMSSRDGSKRYETVKEVIEGGEQLEHFHSYQSGVSSLSVETEERRLRRDDDDTASTIALHTDQGFFIAFTPGMIVQAGGKDMTMSDGFYIEDSQGRRSLVQFDDEDDLVFMLGDGVNQ